MTTDYDSILTATDSNVVNRTEYYKIGASMPDDTVAMAVRPQPIGNDTLIAGTMVLMFFILSAIVCKGRATLLYRIKELFTFNKKSSIDECSADTSGESLSLFLLLLMTAACASVIFFNPIIEESITIPYVDTPYWLSRAYRDAHVYECDNYEEFKERVKDGGFFLCHWDGTAETEAKIKEETQATIRCVPFAYEQTPGVDMVSGKPAVARVIIARSY